MNTTRAIEQLLAIVRADPTDMRARLKLGDVYALTGNHPNALEMYEEVGRYYAHEGFMLKAVAVYKVTRMGIATATAPFAPRAHEGRLIRAHARLLGAPIGFVGDLDPHGIHVYGSLRSGDLDAPDIGGKKLRIAWFGIDDDWLNAVQRRGMPLAPRLIRMGWVEREYWGVIKRLAPRVRALIGEKSFQMLEDGLKAETDAFGDVMVPMLRARLKG